LIFHVSGRPGLGALAGHRYFNRKGDKMSNVIRILEALGSEAPAEAWNREVSDRLQETAALSPEIAAALISGDQASLVELLGARCNVFCGVFPAKNDEEEEEKAPAKEEDDDSKDDGEKNSADSVRITALAS
jgi:hypothetical protein